MDIKTSILDSYQLELDSTLIESEEKLFTLLRELSDLYGWSHEQTMQALDEYRRVKAKASSKPVDKSLVFAQVHRIYETNARRSVVVK